MTRYPAQQLELSISLAEGVTLREELARMREACIAWQEEIGTLERMVQTLRQERDITQAELSNLRSALALAQIKITGLTLQLTADAAKPAALPPWLAQELRTLLTLVHPDRWSQGQPATALAHEVAVAVNGLRQRLVEVA